MKIRLALATATAMGLLMGAAAAGSNNKTSIVQNGQENQATVNQNGNNNSAGTNSYGPSSYNIRQDGSLNVLTIDQAGDRNSIGLNNSYSQNGVKQVGDRNKLDVDQSAGAGGLSGNEIGVVRQVGAAGAGATTNSAAIVQTGSGRTQNGNHQVGYLLQNNTGALANSATITQTGGGYHLGNRIGYRASNSYAAPQYFVRQDGTGNTIDANQAGARNKIGYLTQDGAGNTATLTQDNAAEFATLSADPVDWQQPAIYNSLGNLIENVDQDGAGNTTTVTQDGDRNRIDMVQQNSTGIVGNTATLSFEGNDNGAAGLGFLSKGFADSVAGTFESQVKQNGSENTIDFDVLGSSNQFGFRQNGDRNTTGNVQLNGSYNEIGVDQNGTDNVIDLSTVNGSSNDIGVKQIGGGNKAKIGLSDSTAPTNSDLNSVRVQQTASSGAAAISNLADISIDGDMNLVDVGQDGDNSATVTIDDGDSNSLVVNQGMLSGQGGFNTAAVTVDGSSNALNLAQNGNNDATIGINGDSNNNAGAFNTAFFGAGLTPGQVTQSGGLTTANSITLNVGLGGASSSNLFAFSQDGNNNKITGRIDGGSNQTYVAQVGSNNTAAFVQNGGTNFLKVQQ